LFVYNNHRNPRNKNNNNNKRLTKNKTRCKKKRAANLYPQK